MKSNTYLHFQGNCEEAIAFYKKALDGEITQHMRFKDAPPEVFTAPDFAQDWIMHCTLVAGEITIHASDFFSENEEFTLGNNFAISINTDHEEGAVKVFNNLKEGGEVVMPFDTVFWGGKFGMIKDKFNVSWMLSLNDTVAHGG